MSVSAGKKNSRMTKLAVGLFILIFSTFVFLFLLSQGLFTITIGSIG
ncbi:hypothetical protein LCGC14_0597040 [marine sediment metagenome]|uniref:Uncharacterized protein n=1 Tax=marine sediment metagenome TaxID=412755 RepID=A0A0F9TXW0_9ZZZZ